MTPTEQRVSDVVSAVLDLGERGSSMTSETRLFGAMPELDSLAVLELIEGLEDEFGVTFGDEDINESTFGTVGSIAAFVDGAAA